ncbi:MAG TPA: iron uptake transporter permease EfeU [bacterium]|nr:iron uptake transporter permease EfeU [bacterium]
MFSAFLITLREGLEMSLIVGIIFAYLARTGKRREFGAIWAGVAGAVALSLLTGAVILATAGEFRGRAEQLFEGAAMVTAVGVLTFMVFWMQRQASAIRSELQSRLGDALRAGSRGALVALTVVSVGREGIETALFLFAAVRASSPILALSGAILGLACAVVLGALIYRGSHRLRLRTFFNVTSVLLLLVGAGLLARGVGEFQEAAILPPLVAHLWDTHAAIPETSALGNLLQAVFGYISAPSLLQVALYLAYLAAVGWSFLRPTAAPAGRPGTDGVRRAADAPAQPKV